MYRMVRMFLPVSAVMLLAAAPGAAQGVSPSHVYQVCADINAQIEVYHIANDTSAPADPDQPAMTERTPRHVLQKSREILLKAQALRLLRGMPEELLPAMPVREITPADVKVQVDAVLVSLRGLAPAFGNPPPPAPTPAVEGKTPADNVVLLNQASLALDGLGLPALMPNDVYRLAVTIVADLEAVRAARGVTTPIVDIDKVAGKKPVDIYLQSFALLSDLKDLVESSPDFAIPKGVILPNRRNAAIKPAHVVDMLNYSVAELTALKAKLGIAKPTELAPAQTGKTPSDSFVVIERARALVASLKPTQG